MDGLGMDAVRERLTAAGVRLTADGDMLRVLAPPGALTSELRQAITELKAALLAALTEFRPLDPVVAESEAGKHSLTAIESRLARLTARAAAPEATALDKQLVNDWRLILLAKHHGLEVA